MMIDVEDLQKMLDHIHRIAFEIHNDGNMLRRQQWAMNICEIANHARNILEFGKRNCDVGTVKEQAERFFALCHRYASSEEGCPSCPVYADNPCGIAWAQLPYKPEEDSK